jgi:hypothetical protein
MARTLSLTALLHKYDGDYAAGLKLVDQALMIQRSRDPIHPDVAVALQIRGDLLISRRDFGWRSILTNGLEVSERALGPEHPLSLVLLLRESAVSAKSFGDPGKSPRPP